MKNNSESTNTRKISLTNDFNHFVTYHTQLSDTDATYVKNLFQHDHIKKTLRVSLVILLWSLINSFLDITLAGWGIVETAVIGFSLFHFVPWFLLVILTFTAKYIFVTKVDSDNYFTTTQKILIAFPAIGVFLFLSSVFSKEKRMLRTAREYLHYVRRRGITFIINLLNKAVTLK